MRVTATCVIWIIISICFVACSKDNNKVNSSKIAGNWSFNGIHANTFSSAMDVEGGIRYTTETTSEYTTSLNGGTVNITGNTMTGTGITYAAEMNIFVTDYEGTTIIDTFSTTAPFNISPTNSTSTFEIIGTDSIHYTSANGLGSGGAGMLPANGSKFSISGDILTLTSNVVQDKIFDTLGVTITQHETATVVNTLRKQE